MIIVAVTITKQHWQTFRAWPLSYLHNWLHLPRHNFHPTHPVLHVEYMGCICLACRTLVHVLHMYRWLKFAVDPWTCTYSCALKPPLSITGGQNPDHQLEVSQRVGMVTLILSYNWSPHTLNSAQYQTTTVPPSHTKSQLYHFEHRTQLLPIEWGHELLFRGQLTYDLIQWIISMFNCYYCCCCFFLGMFSKRRPTGGRGHHMKYE